MFRKLDLTSADLAVTSCGQLMSRGSLDKLYWCDKLLVWQHIQFGVCVSFYVIVLFLSLRVADFRVFLPERYRCLSVLCLCTVCTGVLVANSFHRGRTYIHM